MGKKKKVIKKKVRIPHRVKREIFSKDLIDLDECVINALNFLSFTELPEVNFSEFIKPLVVGSGNALATGKILFEDIDAVFADESNFKKKIEMMGEIDGVFLISASGGKHAPIIAQELRNIGLKIILLTNNENAPAKDYVYKTIVFPKQVEPYSYNVSTYMSMILSKTKENPTKILNFIQQMKKDIPKNLRNYNSFYFIVPENFALVKEMFLTKFDELFGGKIFARAYTFEQTKHAKTIVPNEKELFVSFGVENEIFGQNRLKISLHPETNYAALIAQSYYFIGQIQKQNSPYFKKNIEKYTEFISNVFGEKIDLFQ